MSSLPRPAAPTLRELLAFDLRVGTWTALSVLRRRLGLGATLRVGLRILLSSFSDPLRALSTSEDWSFQRERLVRHQLRAAVRLDDALASLPLERSERQDHLRAVISETGAAFIGKNVPLPERGSWLAADADAREDFARRVVKRFFNAKTENMQTDDERMGFDVRGCRFVELCRELERPHLAPLFCEADSVFFERPDARLQLVRTETLAKGGERCDFRLRLK